VTPTRVDTKATPTVVASSSPETSTKSGDSASVPKTVASTSSSDSVAPTATPTVAVVPTVLQGVYQVKLRGKPQLGLREGKLCPFQYRPW